MNRYLGGDDVTDIHGWLAATHGFRGTADDVYRWLMVELGIGR